jgi:two-component sensor histidine kinase
MTLRARIYLLVALAALPAFSLLAFAHYRSLQIQTAEAEQQALRTTWLVSAELEQVFRGVENLLRAAAQTPMVRQLDNVQCTEYLSRLEGISGSAGWILAVDARGTVRCGRNAAAISVADRDYFIAALKTDELAVGTYTIGRASGTAVLPLAIRLQTAEGPGVLAIGLRLDWMRTHFADRFSRLPPNSSLTIADRNGIMLVRLPNSDRVGQALTHYEFVVHATGPGTFRSTAENNADGIARFLGYTPLESPPRGVAIAVGYPQGAALAEVRAGALLNYALFALVTILAAFAAFWGGRAFIRRPMDEILVTLDRWRGRDLTARIGNSNGPSEFSRLGQAFNSMAEELTAALRHKDVLLRELSHRVMNSLQTISALLRLESRSIQDPAAATQFERAIRRLDAVALAYRRMQASDGIEVVEFSALLTELCDSLSSAMLEKSCVVKADHALLSPKVAIGLSLIVNELVTNAVKHGASGIAPIVVEFRTSEDRCRLAVTSAGALPAGFKPESKGFGMKMISSIAKDLNGEFKVSSRDGTSEFAVTFPPMDPAVNAAEQAGGTAAGERAEPRSR